MTAREYLKNLDENHGTIWTEDDEEIIQAFENFAKTKVLEELGIVVEHPTKPGYKRSDIVNRIAEIKRNGRL